MKAKLELELVVCSKKFEPVNRPTKFKLAIISPTMIGEKPKEIFFKSSCLISKEDEIFCIINKLKKYLMENDQKVSVRNGFYVSQGTDLLSNGIEIEDKILADIKVKIKGYYFV